MKLTQDQWKQLRESRGMGMGAPPDGVGPMRRDRRDGRDVPPPPLPPGAPAPPTNGPGGPGQGPGAGMDQ